MIDAKMWPWESDYWEERLVASGSEQPWVFRVPLAESWAEHQLEHRDGLVVPGNDMRLYRLKELATVRILIIEEQP